MFPDELCEEIHEVAATVMMVLAGLHVIGVLGDWLLTGENIIKAMVTGRKAPAENVPPAPAIGAWRGAVLAALVLLGTGWMIDQTRFENVDNEHEEHEEQYDEEDEDDHHERYDDDD